MTTYTNDELRQLFQSKFDLGTWTDVLKDLFLADELRTSPEALSSPGDCDQAYYLGALNTGDNYRIGFFYYEIKSSKVARKKVGLRKLVRTFINPTWGMFDAALVVFNDGAHWRLSFICDIKGENTAPRRYTFVFGDATQGCRTAIERFALLQEKGVSFASLMEAFSVEKLSQEFYEAIFEWYQWACSPDLNVTFANNPDTAADDRDHLNEKIIRLITRLLFCWFIKQKGLVPNELFAKEWAMNHLVDFDFNLGVNPEKYNGKVTDFDPDSETSGNYYAAVLQNLFFATLNTEKNERNWANGNPTSNDNHYGIKTLWRDNKGQSFFKNDNGQVLQALFDKIPYLNGGLFECLDKPKSRTETKVIYYDAFSRDNLRQKRAFVPNVLFFKKDKGLFEILNRFNFTIEESSHDEQQVALDPELLGKVFEKLLCEFNPETQENARKNSGSFYTPREIVDYMVKQSLREYLSCAAWNPYLDEILEGNLPENLGESTKQDIINRIKAVKILDPACGSGAFPMGCLNKIVDVVSLLSGDDSAQSRYQTKLDIIRNCIYGVDIQPIAMMISKLRFFISLICDCPSVNVPTLPNLETKFVAANTLIAADIRNADYQDTINLLGTDVDDTSLDGTLKDLKQQLFEVRSRYVTAKGKAEKKALCEQDNQICQEIANHIQRERDPEQDQQLVEKYQADINKLEIEAKQYEAPNFQDSGQQDLFGDDMPKSLFSVDVNEPKRKELKGKIDGLNKLINAIKKRQNGGGNSINDKYKNAVKQLTEWDPYNQNAVSPFFDPEWMFGISGGFDVVIGNPPYISAPTQIANPELAKQREILAQSTDFETLYQKWDLYVAFMEKGLKLLSDNGAFSMIVPYPITNQLSGKKFRKWVLSNYNVTEISDLHETKVFENATVQNIILFASKGSQSNQIPISTIEEGKKFRTLFSQDLQSLVQDQKTQVWNLTQEHRNANRHQDLHVLGDFCYISKGMVLYSESGLFTNKDLVSDYADEIHCRKYIEAKDIERYEIQRTRYLEYDTVRVPDQVSRPTFRELYDVPKLITNCLGELKVTVDLDDHYICQQGLRIAVLWKDIATVENKSITSSIKKYSSLSRKEMEELSTKIDLRYILGIMASKYGRELLTIQRAGDYHIVPEHIRQIPIPLDTSRQQEISTLVTRILTSKSNGVADTRDLEKRIDEIVYQLYGLSDEEIRLVENN